MPNKSWRLLVELRGAGVSLEGNIGEISFADLIQMCAHIKCTGALVVELPPSAGAGPGRFFFEAGELRDAVLGADRGAAAVYRALALRQGAFHVDPGARSSERRIFSSVG